MVSTAKNVTAESLIKRHGELLSARSELESIWRECYDNTYPLRGKGLSSNDSATGNAKTKRAELMDSTATDCTRTLASMLVSGMTPANSQWFELKTQSEVSDDDTQSPTLWLEESAKVLWREIHNGNFDSEVYESFIDAVVAGWFVLYIDYDAEEQRMTFAQWPISQCCVASSSGVAVDTVYRTYKLTAQQAMNQFGDKAGSQVAMLAEKEPDSKIDFLHVIQPRSRKATGVRSKELPYASYWVNVTDKLICKESGYHEMPFTAPRIQKIEGCEYAVGLVFDALPDIKELNELKKLEKKAAARAVLGTYVATDDGILNPSQLVLAPGKIIIASDVNNIKELPSGSDLNIAFTSEDRLQAQIRRTLLADQLQPQDSPAMTATEVNARTNLIRQQLGPLYGRFQPEFLIPLIRRCLGLAVRNGIIPPSPEGLTSSHVAFNSPLARAQRLVEVGAIEQFMQWTLGIIQVAPDVMDNCDIDKASREMADALGVPRKLIRSDDDVSSMRQQRAEQQQQQQQQEMNQQLAMNAGNAQIEVEKNAQQQQSATP